MDIKSDIYETLWEFRGQALIEYNQKRGYADMYVIDAEKGFILFTIRKGEDLGHSLKAKGLKDSPLAKLLDSVLKDNKAAFVDFFPYSGNPDNAPGSFIGTPITDFSGKVIGVVAAQIPVSRANSILHESTGLGKTGESYLVGSDHLMRSDSTRDPENHSAQASFMNPDKGRITTEAVEAALKGEEGVMKTTNYLGRSVIAAYTPVEFLGNRWALISDIEEAEAFAQLNQIKQETSKLGQNINQVKEKSVEYLVWLVIIMAVIFLGVGILVTFLVASNITKPIKILVHGAQRFAVGDISRGKDNKTAMKKMNDRQDELGETGRAFKDMAVYFTNKAKEAQAIAAGDLTVDVQVASESDVLGKAFQAMIDSLNEIMHQVKNTAVMLASGADQVSNSSHSLSQGATQQASSIEEISASMEEIRSQTISNAETADQANNQATDSKQTMEQSNQQMQKMIESIEAMEASSKEIAKIIKTIDDIAFQTNLLALNAAVEAARAGKHGKGFAVVAQEVRNLAGRSGKAAQETSVLIENTLRDVENSITIVQSTAKVLQEMVGKAVKTADLIGEIALASNQQSQGISQVNQGLSQVEGITQQNTAHAEETASASVQLSDQAEKLNRVLQRFIIKETLTVSGRKQQIEYNPGDEDPFDDLDSEDE